MKKHLFIIALTMSVLALQSCQQKENDIERWGEISSYPDWWLNKYQPVTIERNLHIEFNKDAMEDFEREVVLALYRIDDLGSERPARPEDVQLFVNGEPAPDNTLHIGKNDSDIRVGLRVNKEFLKENGTTTFNWKFKVADNGGLDYINDFEVSGSDETPLLRDNTSMDVYHKRIKNKPRVITDTSLLTILAAIVAFIIFIQLVTAKFTQHQLGKVFITLDGIRKNIMSMSREAKGAKQIIITGKKKSQGILSKIFQCKDCYLFIRGLESDIVLTPGKRFQSKARCSHQFYETEMAGDMNELKVIKGQTQDGNSIEVEFYAKNK